MTLQQIRYFISVYQNLSFTKAASLQHVSQTAVSHQIRLLEEEIGIDLFDRSSRSVYPTSAGRMFYEDAIKIIDLADHSIERIRRTSGSLKGEITISLMPGLEHFPVFEAMYRFRIDHPEIAIHFQASGMMEAKDALKGHQTDLALIIELFPLERPYLEKLLLGHAQQYVVVRKDSRFAQYSSVTRAQLAGEPFFSPGVTQEEFDLTLMQQTPYEEKVTFYTDSNLETLLMKISFYGGYTILAEPVMSYALNSKHLTCIPLEGEQIPIALLYRKDAENPALKELLSYFREAVQP